MKEYDWGFIAPWAETDSYCANIVIFKEANAKTSMHFYKNTDKTWFVNAGKFVVRWIDTQDGQLYEQQIEEGGTFRVEPYKPVQLQALVAQASLMEVTNGTQEEPFHVIPAKNIGVNNVT